MNDCEAYLSNVFSSPVFKVDVQERWGGTLPQECHDRTSGNGFKLKDVITLD